jgi:glycosyltransferase involved in cell wall biosynthesis
MKRVLFLAYLFPPIANSGTQRSLKFVKYLRDFGWDPIVVTAARCDGHPADPALLSEVPDGVRVVRVPMLNEKVAAAVASLAGGNRFGHKIGDAISWRLRRLRPSPDLYALWKPTVVREAMRIFEETDFDAVFATGFPWTALLAGAEIARATHRPFVADFRDPWADEHRFREAGLPRERERALEASVVNQAAAVLAATTSVSRLLAASHPDVDDEKFVAIHNGFDGSDFAPRPARDPNRPFRIVFTGVWKEYYGPGELYDAVDWIRRSSPRLLDGVEIITAGFTPGEAKRRHLDAHITELGMVGHDRAVAVMQSADIAYLPHLDPDRQWAIPGKLYEYVASGAPVMALTDPDKETAQILRAIGGGMVLPPADPGVLYQALAEVLRSRTLAVAPRNAEALAGFERRQLTGKLAGVLDRITSAAPVAAPAPRMSPAA